MDRSSANAVAREYVAGHPLGNREAVSDTFFHDLNHLARGNAQAPDCVC